MKKVAVVVAILCLISFMFVGCMETESSNDHSMDLLTPYAESSVDNVEIVQLQTTKPKEPSPTLIIEHKIKITKAYLTFDAIGTPELNIAVKNEYRSSIDAFDIVAKCYNSYGEQLSEYDVKGDFYGTYQGFIPSFTEREEFSWKLHGFDNATTVKVAVTKYHITDENTSVISESEYTWIKTK